VTADEALGALVRSLEQLRQIFPTDKATWIAASEGSMSPVKAAR